MPGPEWQFISSIVYSIVRRVSIYTGRAQVVYSHGDRFRTPEGTQLVPGFHMQCIERTNDAGMILRFRVFTGGNGLGDIKVSKPRQVSFSA